MKLTQLLNEIRVNTPTRVIFDILTEDEAQKQDLIRCIKNGEPFYESRIKVFVEPKTYPLGIRIEDGKPYKITLIAAKAKEGDIINLSSMYRQMAYKSAKLFDSLEKLLSTSRVPYKIEDGYMAGGVGIESMYIELDENYIDRAFRIDGTPFRNLNEIKVVNPASVIDIKTSIPRDKAINAIKMGFFHQDKDENDSLGFSMGGYNFKPEYIGNIDMEGFDDETEEAHNGGLEIYMAAFSKDQIKTLINLCKKNKIFYLATERNMIIQIPDTKYSYLSVNGMKIV